MVSMPGLTVIFPSHRHDIGRLLERATLDWLHPVVFFEHKLLYGVTQDSARLPCRAVLACAIRARHCFRHW